MLPNLFVSGLAFGGSHIQLIHAYFRFDVSVDMDLG